MAKSRDDLENKLTALERKAVAGAVKATGKQPDEGRLTARERVATLLDPGTFVEEFMLAANEAVARLFSSLDVPFIRRTHPGPELEDAERLRTFVQVSRWLMLRSGGRRGCAGP